MAVCRRRERGMAGVALLTTALLAGGCAYRLGRAPATVDEVLLEPVELLSAEPGLAEAVERRFEAEVRGRVALGGECPIRLTVRDASRSRHLGGATKYSLAVAVQLGEDEPAVRRGERLVSHASGADAALNGGEAFALLAEGLIEGAVAEALTGEGRGCR